MKQAMSFLGKLLRASSKQTITVVSGLPRSGTSMMMKMLEAGGIPPLTDEIREADTDNPMGYYEHERVKKMDKGDTKWLEEAQGKAVKVITALLKHLPSTYQYKIIFVYRDMPEILASQKKMLDHRGEEAGKMGDEEMAMLFARHLESVDQWLGEQTNMSVLRVHYGEILADPESHVARINEFLGGSLNTAEMIGVVDPELYRNR
jgi:hypothetical protein